jgi:4-amino-4-deoxy-L-arabinose transferase-like glycosyltransferase
VRLPALGATPLRLADSARADAAFQVAAGRLPAVWNGDIAQTLTAAFFKLFGAGDAGARLAGALLGVGVVAALWWLRPSLGRAPALIAAVFVALSPTCVAVARSLSPYAAGALFAVLATAALFAFVQRPRPEPLAWLAGILGLGFATDASFLVFLLAAVLFCLIEGFWRREGALQAAGIYLRERRRIFLSLAPIFLGGFLLATTHFGLAPDRLRAAAFLSWSDAFSAGAIPWHFPFAVLLAYEPLVLAGGIGGLALLGLRRREQGLSLFERFLLYWTAAALLFALIAPNREMGQLPMLLVPLALLAGIGVAHWLSLGTWQDLRNAALPALLAAAAFVYVLFVLESSTIQMALPNDQVAVLVILLIGGVALLVLGVVWAGRSAPAFLTLCGLILGIAFALHTLTRVGFSAGDEFLLGPVASQNAPAFGQEVARVGPSLDGPVSLAPALTEPIAWYARQYPGVLIEAGNSTSGGVVQPVDQAAQASFQPLIASNEVARSWYPATIDFEGIVRWLLYRQAWNPVQSTKAEFLIKSK